MISRLDQAMRFEQTALKLLGARQEILSSNIANADTPNYKAKDIDFASALKNALAGTSVSLPLVKTSPPHFDGYAGDSILGSPVMYRTPLQPSADGNTVDMDVERAQFANNALRYEASVNFSGIKSILLALQG